MFNGVHEVTALVGHEFYQDKYNNLSANRSNMFDPSNDELDGAILSGESGSYRTYYNNEGWLFRGQYNYAQKYFGSVSFRRDASSRFPPRQPLGQLLECRRSMDHIQGKLLRRFVGRHAENQVLLR